ncbi:hypothetical protein F8M41_026595 [Gigaspora margarita]|uniref:Uncharacterized protein n=1 Tax=Gigaspora margarita TaxID=4874 RepID=A0A8H3XJ11_GIGMA|nr:hypothetical protein F8M41_026595 [Gigaspora margarita]
MSKDITTYFTHFVAYSQKAYHEYFVTRNCIPWKYLENNQQQHSFYPHLWHYDDRHTDFQCPFRRRCDYFKLLQSVDKSLSKNEKLINMNSRGSLM